MNKSSKNRKHQRIPCDLELTFHDARGGNFIGAGRFLDIAAGGGALETDLRLERGLWYELRWKWREETLRIPARVAWDGHRDPRSGSARYGMAFSPHPSLQNQVKAIIEQVRAQLWNTDGKDKRDFWKV